jgi:hypothetical protein
LVVSGLVSTSGGARQDRTISLGIFRLVCVDEASEELGESLEVLGRK